jgi:WD40 repeat protein
LKLANQEILELRAARAEAASLHRKAVAELAVHRIRARELDVRKADIAILTGRLDVHLGVFSPDRKVIAGAQGKTVTIFDAETLKELRRFAGHSEEVSGLAFAPHGKTLASGSKDKTVVLWDIQTGKQIATFSHQEPVVSVIFSPDGKHVVVQGKSMTSEIDAATGKLNRVTKNEKDK